MSITRNNYEEYFIDYLDGNLLESEIHELESFMLKNPDLRSELEGLEKIVLTPSESIQFSEKENLRQIDLSLPVCHENFEFFCIADSEGDLSPGQSEAFQDWMKANPSYMKQRKLFSLLKVKPDTSISFPEKSSLRKSFFLIPGSGFYRLVAVAAGIALLSGLFFLLYDNNPEIPIMAEGLEVEETTDTTGVKVTGQEDSSGEENSGNRQNSVLPLNRNSIRKAATKVSFKVDIPIASAEPEKTEKAEEFVPDSRIQYQAFVNPDSLKYNPLISIKPDKIEALRFETKSSFIASNANEYMSLDEFVKQKFSELIFREKEAEITVLGIASAGVEKINDLTGAEMKLEASGGEDGELKKLNFNSRILSFSTPINREE